MLRGKEKPPINAIAEGVAAITKAISAMDGFVKYLRIVQNAGCFGKDAATWGAAIIKMEAQLDGMREDRKTYIELMSLMAQSEQKLSPPSKPLQYLTGSAREEFVKGATDSCMQAKIKDDEMKIIPNSLVAAYCRCYATSLVNRITIADMKSDNKAVTDPIVKAAATPCYQAMKAEALRLYNTGQYPKQ
jgi:hypothetical protein